LREWNKDQEIAASFHSTAPTVKRGCDLLILFLIHDISRKQKKPPGRAAKREVRSAITADVRIIRLDNRAVKSTLTMLLIGDNFALQ
jgi:hypothetical protein